MLGLHAKELKDDGGLMDQDMLNVNIFIEL